MNCTINTTCSTTNNYLLSENNKTLLFTKTMRLQGWSDNYRQVFSVIHVPVRKHPDMIDKKLEKCTTKTRRGRLRFNTYH